MATKKIENAQSLKADAKAAALKAIDGAAKVKGFSKAFTAAVLKLGALGTDDAAKAAEELGTELTAIAGGKGYASNAKRILSGGQIACQKALDYCMAPENGGFMAPGNLFKKFPDDFPTLTESGRAKKAEAAPVEGVDLGQPAGWLVALESIRAKVPGQKAWTSDDIVAIQDSAARMVALIKRNTK